MRYYEEKLRHNRALLELVHPGSVGPPEANAPAAEPEQQFPNFDGGARETPLAPSDPSSDHDQLVTDLLGTKEARFVGGRWEA